MMKKMNRQKMRTLSSNHTLPYNSRSSSKMQMTRIVSNLDSVSSSPKRKSRGNLKMLDKAIVFLLGQSAMDVKGMDT